MARLVSVSASERKGKRYKATFDDGTTTHFGQAGGNTFIDHKDDAKRQAYIARHSKNNENWGDRKSAGALARWILWEEPRLSAAIAGFRRRFK